MKNFKYNGQGLVEFALILPILLLLLLGIAEGAHVMQAYIASQSAVRETARYAVAGQPFVPGSTNPSWGVPDRIDDIMRYATKHAAAPGYSQIFTTTAEYDTGLKVDCAENCAGMIGIRMGVDDFDGDNTTWDWGNPGVEGQNIRVEMYHNVAMFDPIYQAMVPNNYFTIRAAIAMRNEGGPPLAGTPTPYNRTPPPPPPDGTPSPNPIIYPQEETYPAGSIAYLILQSHSSNTTYDIYVDSVFIGSTSTDPNGMAYISYPIPSYTPPNNYAIESRLNGETIAVGTLTVTYSDTPLIVVDGGDVWPLGSRIEYRLIAHRPDITSPPYQIELHQAGGGLTANLPALATDNIGNSIDPPGNYTIPKNGSVNAGEYIIQSVLTTTAVATRSLSFVEGCIKLNQGDCGEQITQPEGVFVNVLLESHAYSRTYIVKLNGAVIDANVATNQEGKAFLQMLVPHMPNGVYNVTSEDAANPGIIIASAPLNIYTPTGAFIHVNGGYTWPAGTKILYQLRNHLPNTRYDIYWRNATSGATPILILDDPLGTTDANGMVWLDYTIPVSIQGTYRLQSRVNPSTPAITYIAESNDINVTPTPYLEIAEGNTQLPGVPITVLIRNHAINTRYDVYIGSGEADNEPGILMPKSPKTTDVDGNGEIEYTIPVNFPPGESIRIRTYPTGNTTDPVAETLLNLVAADLIIESITAPANPALNGPVVLTLTVRNNAPVTITHKSFDADVYLDPVNPIELGRTLPPGDAKVWLQPPFPGNSSRTFTTTLDIYGAQPHTIWGRADTSNRIAEGDNENNNLNSIIIEATTCGAVFESGSFSDSLIEYFGDAAPTVPDTPQPRIRLTSAGGSTNTNNDNAGGSGHYFVYQDFPGAPPTPPPPSDIINFNDYTILSAHSGQDTSPYYEIQDNGATLYLQGDTWKKINFPYNVTSNTVIEFDFRSDNEGEFHGFSFTDADYNHDIKLYGSQNWGLRVFDNYPGTGWVHYIIPVGQLYTGNFNDLVFIDDDDANVAAISYFSNIKVYEYSAPPPDLSNVINFNNHTFTSYGGQDGGNGQPSIYDIQDGGATLHMDGNTWKKIDFTYNFIPATVLEFDFRSDNEGEFHGLTFDNNNNRNGSSEIKLYGTQNWGVRDFDNYSGSNWVHYTIPVGQYYAGAMNYFAFISDDDGNGHADSYFRNVIVNAPPFANAGDGQTAAPGDSVTLDGSASNDPDNGPSPLTYNWTQTGGPSVTINNANQAQANFTPPAAGTYYFLLTVSDGAHSHTDTVAVSVTPGNSGPSEFEIQVRLLATDTTVTGEWGLEIREAAGGADAKVSLGYNSASGQLQTISRPNGGAATLSNIQAAAHPGDTPSWLRIIKDGSTIELYTAADNGNGGHQAWGSAVQTLTMSDLYGGVLAGLYSSSGSGSSDIFDFDNFRICQPRTDCASDTDIIYQAPLSATDTLAELTGTAFGAAASPTPSHVVVEFMPPQPASPIQVVGSTVTMQNKGSGTLNDTGGGYLLAYHQLTGNFDVRVRLDSQTPIEGASMNPYAKSGLEIRASLATGADKLDWVSMRQSDTQRRLQWLRRVNNTVVNGELNTGTSLPVWLRIIRNGDTFTLYYSYDTGNPPADTSWSWNDQIEQTISGMPEQIYLGLINSSASATDKTQAVFSNYHVCANQGEVASCGEVREVDGMAVINASNEMDNIARTRVWTNTARQGKAGLWVEDNGSPDSYTSSSYATVSPELQYSVDFAHTGTYYVWLLGYSDNWNDREVYFGLSDAPPDRSTYMRTNSNDTLHWFNGNGGNRRTINIASVGSTSLSVWMRRDGFELYQILLTQDASFDPNAADNPLGIPQSTCSSAGQPPTPPGTLSCSQLLVNGTFEDDSLMSEWLYSGIGEQVTRTSVPHYFAPGESFSMAFPATNLAGRPRRPWLYQNIQLPTWILTPTAEGGTSLRLNAHVAVNPEGSAEPDPFYVTLRNYAGVAHDENSVTGLIQLASGADQPTIDPQHPDSNNNDWVYKNIDLAQFFDPPETILDYANQPMRLFFESPNTTGSYSTRFYLDNVELEACTEQPAPASYQTKLAGRVWVFIGGEPTQQAGVFVWAYAIDGNLAKTYTIQDSTFSFYDLPADSQGTEYVIYAEYNGPSGASFASTIRVLHPNETIENVVLLLN